MFDFGSQYESINTLRGTGNVNFGVLGYLEIGGNNGTSEFDGLMSGTGFTGGFTVGKYGTGTFTLTANNTYANGNDVFGGKLVINGFQPQNPVLSMSTGTTLPAPAPSAPYRPMASFRPATVPASSVPAINFTANGGLIAELTGPNPGAGGYDQLNVTGTVSLANATLTVQFPRFTNPVPLGQQFVIVNNDGAGRHHSGTFAGLARRLGRLGRAPTVFHISLRRRHGQ